MEEQKNLQHNQENNQEKKSCCKMMPLKIILIILNILLIAFLTVEMFGFINQPDSNAKGIAIAAYLVFIVMAIGGISAIVMTVLSLIGLIITLVMRKKCPNNGQLIFFIVFTLLPFIIESAYFLIAKGMQ